DADRQRGRGGPGGPGRSRAHQALPADAPGRAGPWRRHARRGGRPGGDGPRGSCAGRRGRPKDPPFPPPPPEQPGHTAPAPAHPPETRETTRPDHSATANAGGAAIASVSGQVDRIFHVGEAGRQAVLDEACDEARERAVAAGADPGTVQIVELEEIPLAYLTTPSLRIRAKAVGTLGGRPEQHQDANLARQERLPGQLHPARPPAPAPLPTPPRPPPPPR